jgi:hypothetical protein
MASSAHEASASALSYIFQAQLALLELLRGQEDRPDGAWSCPGVMDTGGLRTMPRIGRG